MDTDNTVKVLVMDVDGTMTDGKIYMGTGGEVLKAFDVKDGYAIKNILPKVGIVPMIITGRMSKIVENRAKELAIKELYQGIEDKLTVLRTYAEREGVSPTQIAYIGDDLNDFKCMEWCGMTLCPNDAVDEIKEIADYICQNTGGHGAIREGIEWIVKQRDV